MAMGRRRSQQEPLWVAKSDLPMSPGHPFYRKLNAILDAAAFDAYVEEQCREFFAPRMGRPSLSPGRYFRLLLVGYFEGISSERGIAWRAADSLAIRDFLGLSLSEAGPDHSTISRNRRLIASEAHGEVFTWVLKQLAIQGLVKGKTIAIDATTLEANAAMRSIVNRETGEEYEEYLKRLAEASGVKTPTRAALARFDRRRKRKASNAEWASPSDPDARITRMKDGRTHLAHKAEHAVDVDSGALVAILLHPADCGDTETVDHTLAEAVQQLDAAIRAEGSETEAEAPAELVADKGYHSDESLARIAQAGVRSYISEPDRGTRRWDGDADRRERCYANRRRSGGARGQRLHRQRGERVERSFAHMYGTGAMRRTHLRGHDNILKRLWIQGCALNLGLLLRRALGVGTPRGLQGAFRAALLLVAQSTARWLTLVRQALRSQWAFWTYSGTTNDTVTPSPLIYEAVTFTTGC